VIYLVAYIVLVSIVTALLAVDLNPPRRPRR
jgi:hypothetical protein